MSPEFTAEQLLAVERRRGDLLLDASAGAGKTSVLVERFARSVIEDGAAVGSILAITFTEKAAAELRDRIRVRLRELGANDAARDTESAFISTIHGFCSRVLRTNALAAGLDPSFDVLDESQSGRLATEAFDAALEDLAEHEPGGVELIAGYGAATLRAAILAVHAELRSKGESAPSLPAVPAPGDLEARREALRLAARGAAEDLGVGLGTGAGAGAGAIEPSAKVIKALAAIDRVDDVLADPQPWPADLDELCLPGGNGNALGSAACVAYADALQSFREDVELRHAGSTLRLLDRLLGGHAQRYAERKRAVSGLDFADLELITRDLLGSDAGLRQRYRERFEQIMVDELQDTNPVQLELIESIARGNLFTVGDALQSIYGFRHADVVLFERRRERLAESGAHASLQTNFRSRREILDALDIAFVDALGDAFTPLRTGRADPPAPDPRVELLIADKGADWESEGLAAPWRVAEAEALADRIGSLIDDGAAPSDVVVLTRASTDLRAYERALEDRGVATYLIGGRGYWSHPQVVDLVAYLRALANPRDEEALYGVLSSPFVGVSADALVLLASAARAAGRDPWWVLREHGVAELDEPDRLLLEAFVGWFAAERRAAPRLAIEDLIERVLERTGYDLTVLALAGGERRLANIRKLMRLGREHEQHGGGGLRDFLELVRARGAGGSPDSRESEAPVEGEALDAVRLMTIHRAKGLEFPIVCVADLGREPFWPAAILRVGAGGRVGLRLARPGTGKRPAALEFDALGDEAKAADAREERRLFYVAMTRAEERLILSGAARLESWPERGSPISWIGPAFVPELRGGLAVGDRGVVQRGLGEWRARVSYALVGPDAAERAPASPADRGSACESPVAVAALHAAVPEPIPQAEPAPPVARLSYTSLGEYARCGYRFYLERVIGLPRGRETRGTGAATSLSAAERGILAHALLETLDFRALALAGRSPRPPESAVAAAAARTGLVPGALDTAELQDLVERFAASALCGRIAAAAEVRREQPFSFVLDPEGLADATHGVPVTGVFDVLAREGERTLVVDYKSDRLDGRDPEEVVLREYATQRLVYALPALLAGAREVEVVHVFLELPDTPVSATFGAGDEPQLRRSLVQRARGVFDRRFIVSDAPCRAVCARCPGEGGLCSWPLEMTRRDAPDQLF